MKRLVMLTLCFLIVFSFSQSIALANSAEPPAVILTVNCPPEDIDIAFYLGDNQIEARKEVRAWETYFVVYRSGMRGEAALRIVVQTGGDSFTLWLDRDAISHYNAAYSLDIEGRALHAGTLVSRSILLVAMRVLLTLLIEGFCFYVFRFRQKRSWLVFLCVNLVTQGLLNIALNGMNVFTSYPIMSLAFLEVLVFAAELVAFLILLKEHGKLRRVAFVLAANLLSFILGGILITLLPI